MAVPVPGIWFFSLDADLLPAVLAARALYGLPYHWAHMKVEIRDDRCEYFSRRRHARAFIAVRAGDRIGEPGALEHFLTARFRLYSTVCGRLIAAGVEHPPWPLHRATLERLHETVRSAHRLDSACAGEMLVHFSPGVRVRVGAPRLARKG